jgi:hypothetical protein
MTCQNPVDWVHTENKEIKSRTTAQLTSRYQQLCQVPALKADPPALQRAGGAYLPQQHPFMTTSHGDTAKFAAQQTE